MSHVWTTTLRCLFAAGSGALVFLSYEPFGYWALAVLAMALFFAALAPWPTHPAAARPSARAGACLGLLQALVCYLLLLPWIGEFVGAMPYLALACFLSLYGLLTGAAGVWVARQRWGFAAFALVYLAVEFARSSFPFGGFAWVRLAWGQINGPLANLAAYGGPALVTVAAVVTGASLAAIVLYRGRARVVAGLSALLPLALGALAGVGVSADGGATGTVRAAAIQGNVPRMGLDFNAQRRAVLQNHVDETERLAAEEGPVDLVIWPENASDVNPFVDPEAGTLVTRAARAAGAPLLVGTLTRDDVGARNTMVVINPDGSVGERHNKRFLQPFGEYMPMRDFFRNFSELVDLAGDFKPGDGPGAVRMGETLVGIATCYEVAEDPAYRMAVKNGAQLLATPTNNATFGFTDMTYQQLAMSRMRAIETDRAVVVAATSGVSAIVRADGTVEQQTEIFTPAHLTSTLPLKTGQTLAVRIGAWLEWLMVLAGALAAIGALAATRREYAARSESRALVAPDAQASGSKAGQKS